MKVTLPVGEPVDPETGATFAMNVTLVPKATCGAELVSAVWESVPTVSVNMAEVENENVEFPP
jgi:hypothetical protein